MHNLSRDLISDLKDDWGFLPYTLQKKPSGFVGDVASVIGGIKIGENSNVWLDAVIRDNRCRTIIATNTNLQDNCVVHGVTKVAM